MAPRIGGPGRYDREVRRNPRQEIRRGRCAAAVVSDLEQVGPQVERGSDQIVLDG
jgi:hypothetical protein